MQARGILVAGIVCIAALSAGGVVLLSGTSSAPTPLQAGAGRDSKIALPKNTIIVTLSEGAEITPPFLLHEDSAAVGGVALFHPKGTRTDDHRGKAKFTVTATSEGTYTAWARAHWRDTCSNSFSLKVGEQAERDVGNDDVFNVWHWVPAGKYSLTAGKNPVVLSEREDGIEIDQLLFTPDSAFQPTGQVSPIGCARGIRQFADTFTRSPGHGMDGWDLVSGDWHISFSFDPNRIPNQYALVGEPTKGDAMALIQGSPWFGTRISFSVTPVKDGKFGAVLDRSMDGQSALLAGFEVSGGHAAVYADTARADLGDSIRLDQWHRVTIERWAWILRIDVDGRNVLTRYDVPPRAGRIGLFVSTGSAIFDDVDVAEIPWQADDGNPLTVPWTIEKDAKWFRPAAPPPPSGASATKDGERKEALLGKGGAISTGMGDIPVAEVVLEEDATPGEGVQRCALVAPGLKLEENAPGAAAGIRVFKAPMTSATDKEKPGTRAEFQSGTGDVHIHRVAIRYGTQSPETYFIGPYHFANNSLVDPSDYLDFTPEEYKEMAKSPEAAKLKRVPKTKTLIGREGDDESPWVYESGQWRIRDGTLQGKGPGAVLRHAQEISGDMELNFKLHFEDAKGIAAIALYDGPEPGLHFEIASGTEPTDDAKNIASRPIPICLPADSNWHEVHIRIRGENIETGVDSAPRKSMTHTRCDGGRIRLSAMAGIVEFNDIEFQVPRITAEEYYYPFNRPETDWWREAKDGGQWMDHGGIACVLASSWVSLIAPEGSGMMRNKHRFDGNTMVAFDVEENSEWFGWDKYPNHLHYPYDNITVQLSSPKNPDAYRLVLNTEKRSATILYKDGKEVARVSQRNFYPMRYVGGHGPYFPRRNRICLFRRGGFLRAVVNGKEVLRFEDKAPLETTEVALGGHNTRINFTDIEIRHLDNREAPPAKPIR